MIASRENAGSFALNGYMGAQDDFMFKMFLDCNEGLPITRIVMSTDVFAMFAAALESHARIPISLERARAEGLPYRDARVTVDDKAPVGTMEFYAKREEETLVGEISGWTV